MANKIKIPEKIRKKMRKDQPSLFPLPLPSKSLDKKIEVAPLRFIVNKNKATKICSHCQEHKTSHRCPICAEPTCSDCKIYDDFKIYYPKTIIIRAGTCKECGEELIVFQTLMTFQAIAQIAEQLSEHIKRFLEKFGIEFN